MCLKSIEKKARIKTKPSVPLRGSLDTTFLFDGKGAPGNEPEREDRKMMTMTNPQRWLTESAVEMRDWAKNSHECEKERGGMECDGCALEWIANLSDKIASSGADQKTMAELHQIIGRINQHLRIF